MSSDKLYLPGLNGIRAMAALAVVYSHINLNLFKFDLPKSDGLQLASFGVTMFFTLSGFLITYLLLQEKSKTGTVNIRKFYIRRILRIWPLYFLYAGIVLLIVHYSAAFLYVLFFIPNVAFVLHISMPLLNHYWSLGVEEQFYFFWPWTVRWFSKIGLFLVIFVLLFVVLKIVVKGIWGPGTLYSFLHYTRFGCMAIGALTAYLIFTKNKKIDVLKRIAVELGAWGVILLIAINKFHIFSIIDHELVAIATAIVIFNQVANPSVIISLENRVLDYLGMISFGLYVYNPLIIDLVAKLYMWILPEADWMKYVIIYTMTPVLIILTAHVSYFVLERPFLRWKNSFTIIQSSGQRIHKSKSE